MKGSNYAAEHIVQWLLANPNHQILLCTVDEKAAARILENVRKLIAESNAHVVFYPENIKVKTLDDKEQ